MAKSEAVSQHCCPSLVCIMPAIMPQASIAAHPMPMYMVPPMAAPVVLPQFDVRDDEVSGFRTSPMMSNFVSMPIAWDGSSWPLCTTEESPGDKHGGSVREKVPEQKPMDFRADAPAGLLADVSSNPCSLAWQCQEKVPTQVAMNSMMPEAEMHKMKAGTGTLRHRRGQECRAQGHKSHASGTDNLHITEEQEACQISSNLISQFQAGGQDQLDAIANFVSFAFTSKVTSRAAQMILENVSKNEAVAFASGFRGHIRNAVVSKHANHVVQKITEVMPMSHASFIVDELTGFGLEVSRHVFGCRVLCRILEHVSAADIKYAKLFEYVLTDLDVLCGDAFGSVVVRHLLEFGSSAHKHCIVEALLKDVHGYARHQIGSLVVEAALKHASLEDQSSLVAQILVQEDQLLSMATSRYGCHVARALLDMPGELKKQSIKAFCPLNQQLKESRYGKSVKPLRAAALVQV
jgi:pumilio RNA-binding family